MWQAEYLQSVLQNLNTRFFGHRTGGIKTLCSRVTANHWLEHCHFAILIKHFPIQPLKPLSLFCWSLCNWFSNTSGWTSSINNHFYLMWMGLQRQTLLHWIHPQLPITVLSVTNGSPQKVKFLFQVPLNTSAITGSEKCQLQRISGDHLVQPPTESRMLTIPVACWIKSPVISLYLVKNAQEWRLYNYATMSQRNQTGQTK